MIKDDEVEYCETCNDNYFILSNDEEGNDDLQRCDECNYFESDDDAKNYVLKFIIKGVKITKLKEVNNG